MMLITNEQKVHLPVHISMTLLKPCSIQY